MTNKTLETGQFLFRFEFSTLKNSQVPIFSHFAPIELEILRKRYNGVIHNGMRAWNKVFLPKFQNAIISERVRVMSWNFGFFLLSMIDTNGVNFKKHLRRWVENFNFLSYFIWNYPSVLWIVNVKWKKTHIENKND